MESCWLIEFEDGYKMIISEGLYNQELERNFAGRKTICHQHWFSLKTCRERNRGIPYFGDWGLYLCEVCRERFGKDE